MDKIRLSETDIRNQLEEQLKLLRIACASFDNGETISGKSISIHLRILLHTTRRQTALLQHFDLNSWRILSTNSFRELPRNALALTNSGLLALSISDRMTLIPRLDFNSLDLPNNWVSFTEWWDTEIVHQLIPGNSFAQPQNSDNPTFTRKSIVTHVADTDGGAHVDAELSADYHQLSRNPSVGAIVANHNGKEIPLEVSIHLNSVRQIAAEFLYSLKVNGF